MVYDWYFLCSFRSSNFNTLNIFLFLILVGCSDGSEEQVFQNEKMVGCDGSFTRSNFRSACADGWHVATASDYFQYGGKTVGPNKDRFVDVAWDSSGRETSLDNWQGYYDCYNSGGWDRLCHTSNCYWVSTSQQCGLHVADNSYGRSYGCHCYSSQKGVICVKN